MEARRAGPLLTTLGVLVALAVVAVASRGSTDVGTPGARRPADTLLDVLFTVYIILLALGAILFIYLLAIGKRDTRRSGMETVSKLSLFVIAFILLAGLGGAQRLQGLELARPEVDETPFPPGTGETPQVTTTPELDTYEPEFAWIPVLVLVGLLVVGTLAAWWASVRRRRARTAAEPATLGEALADVLDETLDDLRAERDPRRAVIAAYARLQRVLAAYGLPRRPCEAPFEYLRRVLGDLSVSPEAIRRLTLLFERAKFSQHEVGETMKEEAIAALQTAQEELRAAEEARERARSAA